MNPAFVAVCAEHLATALAVSGNGSYEVRVTQDSFINCCVCDSTAKFAFRRPNGVFGQIQRQQNPLGSDILNVNDGD